MRDFKDHIIQKDTFLRDALSQLDKLAEDAIIFVVDDHGRLLGSLTDGDIRRGLLQGKGVEDSVVNYIQVNPKSVNKANYSLAEIIKLREGNFKIIPVLDFDKRIINVINFRFQKTYLPLDALVMAGGRGLRLKPMTDYVPKPLLKVGEKPIIDYNIDRLRTYGIDDFYISIRYLGEQLEEHYKNKDLNGANVNFIREETALGT